MLARKLLRLSAPLKNSNILFQHVCSYHLTYIENIKDDSNSLPLENVSGDKLLTELNTKYPSKILLTLQNNKKIINGQHIITALTSLVRLYKQEIYDQSNEKSALWNDHNFFKQIYSVVDTKVDKLTGLEAIEILQILIKMKILYSSNIIQSLIQRIHSSLNDLSVIDFGTLSLLIKRMPNTSLIQDLQTKMQRKFIVELSMGFEENNIKYLESALSFLSCNSSDSKLIEIIFNKLQNYNDEIPLKSSIVILESLCTIKHYPKGWQDILHRVEDIIIKNIEFLYSSQVNFILYIISKKIKVTRTNEFYNSELIDKLIQKLINDDTGFENAVSALKCLGYMRHVSKELLNYSCASYFEKTTLTGQTIQDIMGKLLVLISGLAMAKHKTIFWNELQDNLMNNNKWYNYDHKTLAILAFNILCLDNYPTSMLKKVFDDKYNYSNENYLHWTFCKIYQRLKSNQTYEGPMPSESQIASLKMFHQYSLQIKEKYGYQLLCNLEEGMGGPIYVKSRISTKLFHLIDHVVVFQKDGTPFPINSATSINGIPDDIEYLENLNIPPECQIVLILYTPYFWHFRNSNDLIGIHRTTVETLEAMSYVVITINEGIWSTIPDNEKTSFLMKETRSKLIL